MSNHGSQGTEILSGNSRHPLQFCVATSSSSNDRACLYLSLVDNLDKHIGLSFFSSEELLNNYTHHSQIFNNFRIAARANKSRPLQLVFASTVVSLKMTMSQAYQHTIHLQRLDFSSAHYRLLFCILRTFNFMSLFLPVLAADWHLDSSKTLRLRQFLDSHQLLPSFSHDLLHSCRASEPLFGSHLVPRELLPSCQPVFNEYCFKTMKNFFA
jgi:hypothetical protein